MKKYFLFVLVLFVLTKDYIIDLLVYLSENIESDDVSMRLKDLSLFFSKFPIITCSFETA